MATGRVTRVRAVAGGLTASGDGSGSGTASIASQSQSQVSAVGSGEGFGAATLTVGAMFVPTSLWDRSVVSSSTDVVRIDVWEDGKIKAVIYPKSGEVTEDFVTGVRSTYQASFAPTVSYLLTPGVELAPYRGFDYGSGAPELEPLGRFPLNGTVNDADPGQDFTVSCQDRWQWIVNSAFLNGFTAQPGRRIKDILNQLVLDTGMWTSAQIFNTITSNAVATTQVWDTGPHQAIVDLCQAVGAEAFCDKLGNVVFQDRKAAGAPVATIKAGDGERMTAGSISVDISDVFNVVIVKPTNTDPAFVLEPVIVRITDANHPAFPIRGKRITRPYSLDQGQATSQAQIRAMAQKVLTKISAPARQVTLTCLVDCRLKAGQTISVVWPATGLAERLQIQQITYPMSPDDLQRIVGVSTRKDEDFQP